MRAALRRPLCACCTRRVGQSSVASLRSCVPQPALAHQRSVSTSTFRHGPAREALQGQATAAQTVARSFSTAPICLAKSIVADKGKGKAVDMSQFPPERIRNLSIIAHIDHGKSTLADRLLQMTGTLPSTSNPQFLDKLKVERERGITVKAQTVSIIHRHTDGQEYLINLIDTPGHVDFSYEVSRSLGACEGGLLLVDCSQGIQAQTLSVFHVAQEAGLTLLPVINKVDLPHAEPEETSLQIESSLALPVDKHMWISAKSGLGVDEVLRRIVDDLPPPTAKNSIAGEGDKLKALVFDTHYDQFRGVVFLIRIMSGTLRKGDKLRFLQAGKKYEVLEVGIANPEDKAVDMLQPGQVGYMICNMKNSEEALIGDTICLDRELVKPLPGFQPMKAMVYAGVFPTDSGEFLKLEEAIDRLTLNDRSVTVQRESSLALSQGFRLGFLGTLHMDVFRQRLEDEYQSNVIITAPTVPYKIVGKDGGEVYVSNPADFPDLDRRSHVERIEEPIVHATIIIPNDYIGDIMDLCSRYRATQLEYKVMETTGRSLLRYSFPLSEIVTDFFSELKGVSSGFASFDYEEAGYETSDMVKLSILLNGKPVDALAMICHRSAAQSLGRDWTKKLREVVPRQMFELSIQAAIGNKVVARESLGALRKDVTAGLYGGHYERKMKHLEKQKEGKKNLKRLAGNIDVPKSAFFQVLSTRSRSFSTMARRDMRTERAADFDPIRDFLPRKPARTDQSAWKAVSLDDESVERQPIDSASGPERLPSSTARDLSELYRLLDCPITDATSAQLATLYGRFIKSDTDAQLTAAETHRVLAKLSESDRVSSLPRSAHKNRYETMMKDFLRLEDLQEIPIDMLVPWLRKHADPRYERDARKRQSAAARVCQRLQDVQKVRHEWRWDDRLDKAWLAAAHEVLIILGKLGSAKHVDTWCALLDDLRAPASYVPYYARMLVIDRRARSDNQVDGRGLDTLILDILNEARTAKVPRFDKLVDRAVRLLSERSLWTAVGQIYSIMHSQDESRVIAPLLLGDAPSDTPASAPVDSGKQASRFMYSTVLQNLAVEGHLPEAMLVMHDLEQSEWSAAGVPEYSAFFIAFLRYSTVPPNPKADWGEAYHLFPRELFVEDLSPVEAMDRVLGVWDSGLSSHQPGIFELVRTLEAPPTQVRQSMPQHILNRQSMARRPAWENQIVAPLEPRDVPPQNVVAQDSEDKANASKWTLPMLDHLFRSFINLRIPPPAEPYGRRAPHPSVLYAILATWARLTYADKEAVQQVWRMLHTKFGTDNAEGWVGYRLDPRLRALWAGLMGGAEAPTDPEGTNEIAVVSRPVPTRGIRRLPSKPDGQIQPALAELDLRGMSPERREREQSRISAYNDRVRYYYELNEHGQAIHQDQDEDQHQDADGRKALGTPRHPRRPWAVGGRLHASRRGPQRSFDRQDQWRAALVHDKGQKPSKTDKLRMRWDRMWENGMGMK